MSIIHLRKNYAIPRVQRLDLEVINNNINVAERRRIKLIGQVSLPLEIPGIGILQL